MRVTQHETEIDAERDRDRDVEINWERVVERDGDSAVKRDRVVGLPSPSKK